METPGNELSSSRRRRAATAEAWKRHVQELLHRLDEILMSRETAAATSSMHFQASEFACPHCGVALVRPELLRCLERLRARLRHPVTIVSGYRCPIHNAAVGGASNSQHMYAAAADIPSHLATVHDAEMSGFVGIGRRGAWAVHVDVRDGGPARWVYT